MHKRSLLLALLSLLPLTGCGYQHEELYREDVATVAVNIFENRTFYREIEFELAEALIKDIELRTPYKVVSEGRADTLMEGRIVSVQQKQLSRSTEGGLPEQMEVIVTVDFTWKQLNTGRILRERRGFAAVGRYIPSIVAFETRDIGQSGAVEQMAEQIVSVMRTDW